MLNTYYFNIFYTDHLFDLILITAHPCGIHATWVVFDILIGDKAQIVAFRRVELTDVISFYCIYFYFIYLATRDKIKA